VRSEIARGAEVCASLQYRWRRELRGAQHKTPTFVLVRVAHEASDEGPANAPACTPHSPAGTSLPKLAGTECCPDWRPAH
jgi:hypothetical protein